MSDKYCMKLWNLYLCLKKNDIKYNECIVKILQENTKNHCRSFINKLIDKYFNK